MLKVIVKDMTGHETSKSPQREQTDVSMRKIWVGDKTIGELKIVLGSLNICYYSQTTNYKLTIDCQQSLFCGQSSAVLPDSSAIIVSLVLGQSWIDN